MAKPAPAPLPDPMTGLNIGGEREYFPPPASLPPQTPRQFESWETWGREPGEQTIPEMIDEVRRMRQGNQDMLRTIEAETGQSFRPPQPAPQQAWNPYPEQPPEMPGLPEYAMPDVTYPMPTATPGRPPRVVNPQAQRVNPDALVREAEAEGRPSFERQPQDPDAVIREATAAGGLSTPWQTDVKREFDWPRYLAMASAINNAASRLNAPITAGAQQMPIPTEMPRSAPPWQPSSGFRTAFRPPQRPTMAGFLQGV